MKKIYILILSAFISSCKSYIPFTEDLKRNFKKDGIDLTKLQYYSEKNIILNRNLTSTAKELEKGGVSQSNTFIREKISFIGSPTKPLEGVCRAIEDGRMIICFESGDIKEKAIVFYRTKEGEYQFYDNLNYIRYDNNLYEIEKGQGSRLLVSSKVNKKYVSNRRKVRGLQVE